MAIADYSVVSTRSGPGPSDCTEVRTHLAEHPPPPPVGMDLYPDAGHSFLFQYPLQFAELVTLS